MLRSSLFFALTLPLFAETPPASVAEPVSQPGVRPAAEERKEMLNKLIEAGILMLEGKAYRQFIQAFVDDDDRRRFEQAFTKNGVVDYEEWGRQKGVHMLAIFRQVGAMEPVMTQLRACYPLPDIPRGRFSFVFLKGSWFVENKSMCPAEVFKKAEPVPEAKPQPK